MPYAQYWNDARFKNRSDNIYRPVNGSLVWVPNQDNDHDDEYNQARDRSGLNALISDEYWYFDSADSFSLYDYLDEGVVNRLWHRYVGQKYNGLLDSDFPCLLSYLDKNRPRKSSTKQGRVKSRKC